MQLKLKPSSPSDNMGEQQRRDSSASAGSIGSAAAAASNYSPRAPASVIVVGIKLSSECREMLTWIIAKLAQPGDRVVAVHIVRAFADTEDILDSTVKQRLDGTFESVLGVYQSICNLKQVRLDIKVVSGSSLRKTLVESAKMERASVLVLGSTAKNGCSESLAKYCLKRLPSTCWVLVVEHGQVVFGKEGAQSVSGKRNNNGAENATTAAKSCYRQSKGDRSVEYKHHQQQQHQKAHNNNHHAAGWPLMHRSISLEKVQPSRSLSVVKWALQLPDRLKEAFDKQGGVVRLLASSAMPDQLRQENLPRLKSSSASATPARNHHHHRSNNKNNNNNNSQVNAAMETRWENNEVESSRSSGCSIPDTLAIQPYSEQVSFQHKIDSLCKNKACVRFTYEELQSATSNFALENLVGKGGCSKVYRGTLSGGHVVAVKCLKQGAAEADEELLTEVEILSTLNHPNIVGLIGYCVDGETHILVYNFASGGNLEENLHGGKDKPLLSWAARHKIAVGAAEAFVYLHDTCRRPVVHRDVKSSNILLSADFKPQISDFGLAKWAPTSATHITCSDVVGTLGYLAPEYFMFGRVNDKTDVYSFGVVLLELITGRQPIDMSKPKGQENLVAWARPHLDCGAINKLVDPKLEGNYDEIQLRNMVIAATFCLRQSPQYRPRMTRVLRLICGEDSSCPSGRYDLTDEYLNEFSAASETDIIYDNDVRKHLALAMMGVDDDVASQSSADQNSIDIIHADNNLDDYLGGRYSRSSSLDS